MSDKKQSADDEKRKNEEARSIAKRDARIAARVKALNALPAEEAAAKAFALAAGAAHRKQLELEKGGKVTRRERAKIMREMSEGVHKAGQVGYRVRQGMQPTDEQLNGAMTQPDTLIAELNAAARYNAAIAQAVAERTGNAEIIKAVSAHIAAEEAERAARMQEAEKLAAAVATAAATPQAVTAAGGEIAESRGRGRPSDYTAAEGQRICEWIQSGQSLNRYCRENGRQPATVYGWLLQSPEFMQSFALAHANRADTFVEDMIEIADACETATDVTQVMAAKLRIDTRKWIAERMRPEKYGQKVQVEQKGQVVFSLGVPKRRNADAIEVECKPAST